MANPELIKYLIGYTISNDGKRNMFSKELEATFSGIWRRVNESMLVLTEGDEDKVKESLEELCKELGDKDGDNNFVKLYYAAHLKNYTYKSSNELDRIVELQIW